MLVVTYCPLHHWQVGGNVLPIISLACWWLPIANYNTGNVNGYVLPIISLACWWLPIAHYIISMLVVTYSCYVTGMLMFTYCPLYHWHVGGYLLPIITQAMLMVIYFPLYQWYNLSDFIQF